MKYDFDLKTDRVRTSCAKWDYSQAIFGQENLLPFWVADMDFESPRPIADALIRRADHGLFGYTVGDDAYYQAFMDWRIRRFNWKIERDWIVYVPTVIMALIAAVEVFTNPKEKVIIQTPVYASFKEKIENLSRQVVSNPLCLVNDRYKIDFGDLEMKAKDPLVRMLVLCNPHNPVGRVYSNEELIEIGRICNENDVLVFSDEIHSDIVLSEYNHVPYASISDEFARNCIVATSVGKTFNLSGLNMANMIIPNDRIRERIKLFLKTKLNQHFLVPVLGQVALKAGYMYGEDWLEQVIEYIEGNFRYINDYIKNNLPKLKLIKAEATYFAWIDMSFLGLSGQAMRE